MTTYKATVTEKSTGEKITITSDYSSKRAFIKDLRANGYKVVDQRVAEKSKWDQIMTDTNATKNDWK